MIVICSHRWSLRALIVGVTTIALLVAVILFFSIQSSSGRPSGLIQPGNSKTDCIYVELGAALRQVEQDTNIKFNCIETFSNVDSTWSGWIFPWVIQNGYGYKAWLTKDPTNRQVILTINLIPDIAARDPRWLEDCSEGDYDTYAKELSRNLVDSGFGYSVIRLGAEMNGTWNVGSLGTTVTEWHQWGECFAQEVQAMRTIHGSHFLFDWNVNANYRNIPLGDFYPGNAYVDIIGIDAYDSSGISLPSVHDPARWAALTREPEGLDALEAFASAHGKPLSIPEWGTVDSQGDDANYVTEMGAFVASHDVAFQSWFDVGRDGIPELSWSQGPLSLAAYIKAFG
jgi:hypothetical protein